jgi:DNA-binding NarL/FixJ family response regulator
MRVAITDDHGIVREGIRWMLEEESAIEIVAEADSGPALLAILESGPVDVVLLDVRMPDMSGLKVLEIIRSDYPDVRVIMLTMHDQSAYVRRAIELGAAGYVLKSAGREELVRAIEVAAAGDTYLHGGIVEGLVRTAGQTAREFHLSPREKQVLQLIADGYENKQIARELDISEATVKTYVRETFERLGATSRAQAVAIGLREELIS